jgi:hypothetical protein
MTLRKFGSLLLAALMVAGLSSDVSAQSILGDNDGVRIRVLNPANLGFVGIDDSVKVEVQYLTTLAPDNIIIAVVTDTSLTAGVITTTMNDGVSIRNGGVQTASSGTEFVKNLTGAATIVAAQEAVSGTTAFKKVTFTWKITATSGAEVSTAGLAVIVRVMNGGTSGVFNNLRATVPVVSTDPTGSSFGLEGDGIKFGVDSNRPVGAISAVLIDEDRGDGVDVTANTADDTIGGTKKNQRFPGAIYSTDALLTADDGVTSGNPDHVNVPRTAFSTKDILKASFTVSNPPSGATGVIYIADPADVVAGKAADSSFVKFEFTFNDLLGGAVKDSVTLTEAAGSNARLTATAVGDNRRVVAAAYLTDRAGNLSSSGEDDLTPTPTTDPNIHVLDLTDPVITAVRPKTAAAKQAIGALPDSSRFTALITSAALSITTLTDGTAAGSSTFSLNPLQFKVSEGGTIIKVAFDDGKTKYDTTAVAAQVAGLVKATVTSFNLSGGFLLNYDDSSGHAGDLTITFTDSSGNEASDKQTGVSFDGFPPQFRSYFPTTAGAPTDPGNADAPTVNSATANPVLELSEALDSLSVQYVQNTGVSPKVSGVRVSPGDVNLAVVGTPITITLTDTLFSNKEYKLQVFQRDLAGNVSITAAQTLTYDAGFQNPVADEFVIAAANKSVVAGQALSLTITAKDSALSKAASSTVVAVTHDRAATLSVVQIAAATKQAAGSTYSFSGTGVTDNKDGTASLDAASWNLGVRTVVLKGTAVSDKFVVLAQDKTGEDVNFADQTADTLGVESSDFRAYSVKAMEGGVVTDGVSGDFTVWVQPTDEYGNPSAKLMVQAAGTAKNPAASDSLKLLASKIDSQNVLAEVFVEFSSNNGDAQVPEGPQAVAEAGTGFTVVAPDRAGDGLWISVRTFNASGDTTGYGATAATKYQKASGSTGALTFTAFGEAPPAPSTSLEAPKTLIVQDYLGADGLGDQGGFVIVSYSAVAGADRYRLYRQVSVTTGLDENGDLAVLDAAVPTWVSWAAFDPADGGDGVGRNVVPTLDGKSSLWGIAAERGGASSGQTAASKRVFTKQIVQNMVSFLGVDPNRILSTEELGQVFAPSEDYVKSIIGGQKDVQFAALDVDFAALVGGANTVPQSIRTQTSQIQSSARTVTADPVKAVDNLPPTAVEGAAGTFDGGNVGLEWQVSSDDRVVGSMGYLGYSIPIAGVDRYEVWRGESAQSLELYTTLAAGETTFLDEEVPSGIPNVTYRIDAADLDNVTLGTAVDVPLATERIPYLSAAGEPVYIILVSGGTPLLQDFEDFLAFANAFQTNACEPGFLLQADTNDDSIVDFTDFLAFASAFLREAVPTAGTKVVATQPLPGVNDNVELALSLSDGKVLAGQTVTVNVALSNATAVNGFGFEMLFDADKFEYVESAPAEEDLLKSGGAETPLFLAHPGETGQLVIANAVIDGAPVSGNGEVVSLTFKVLQEFEDNARFEIADGIVFDHDQLPNPVVSLGSLSVESTPTKFALLQNFPNPFNPETTIKYNLAEGTNVSLRIYNVVGQVVRTLVSEPQSAGRYTVRWNGSDDRGVSVSSGIYFYEIRSNGFQDVKKLMLLK